MTAVTKNERVMLALADLARRLGAGNFEFGYLEDDPDGPRWWVRVMWGDTAYIEEGHTSPGEAALWLSVKLIDSVTCGDCLRPVVLVEPVPGRCTWHLAGSRWEPVCSDNTLQIGTYDYQNLNPERREHRRA